MFSWQLFHFCSHKVTWNFLQSIDSKYSLALDKPISAQRTWRIYWWPDQQSTLPRSIQNSSQFPILPCTQVSPENNEFPIYFSTVQIYPFAMPKDRTFYLTSHRFWTVFGRCNFHSGRGSGRGSKGGAILGLVQFNDF